MGSCARELSRKGNVFYPLKSSGEGTVGEQIGCSEKENVAEELKSEQVDGREERHSFKRLFRVSLSLTTTGNTSRGGQLVCP